MKISLALLIFTLFLISVQNAEASYIRLETAISSETSNNTLKGSVTVRNSGNEPAYSAQLSVNFLNKVFDNEVKDILLPSEKYLLNYSFDLAKTNNGTYPLIAKMYYKDSSGYKFSTVSLNSVIVGKSLASELVGKVSGVNLSKEGYLIVKVRNGGKYKYNVKATLVLPQEISSEKTIEDFSINSNEEKELKFKIKNFSALRDSSYAAYILLEYDKGLDHIMDYLSTTIKIVDFEDYSKPDKLPIFLIIILLLLLVLCFYKSRDRIKKVLRM